MGDHSGLVLNFHDPETAKHVSQLQGQDKLSNAIRWACEHWADIEQAGYAREYQDGDGSNWHVDHEKLPGLLALFTNPFLPEPIRDYVKDRLCNPQGKARTQKPKEQSQKETELPLKTVYVIQAIESGLVKIGITNDVQNRLGSLRGSSPESLQIVHSFPGTAKDEHGLQAEFAHKHSHREWFSLTEDDIDSIIARYPGDSR